MAGKIKAKEAYCSPVDGIACCQVESVLTVDERGQMVLPKEIRDKAGIRAGDKLALVTMEKDGKICCLSLIKIDELSGMVKNTLGPLMQEIFTEQKRG
jgi:antitoxin PrlF